MKQDLLEKTQTNTSNVVWQAALQETCDMKRKGNILMLFEERDIRGTGDEKTGY